MFVGFLDDGWVGKSVDRRVSGWMDRQTKSELVDGRTERRKDVFCFYKRDPSEFPTGSTLLSCPGDIQLWTQKDQSSNLVPPPCPP